MSKHLTFPAPAQAEVVSTADTERISHRAAPLLDDGTGMMMHNGMIYFTGRRTLDIEPTTVSMPLSAFLAASVHVLQTLAIPMFAQAEVAMAKAIKAD